MNAKLGNMRHIPHPNINERPTPRHNGVCVFEPMEHRRMLSTTAGPGGADPADAAPPVAATSDAGLFAPAENHRSSALTTPATKDHFRVFGALYGPDAGDTLANGITPVKISYGELIARDADGNYILDQVDEQVVRRQAHEAADAGVPWVLDIEHWETDLRYADASEVDASIARFVKAIGWARDERPDVQIGIYGILPGRDYWDATAVTRYERRIDEGTLVDPSGQGRIDAEAKVAAWQAANDALAPLAEAVDVIFPSLYAFYEDQQGWVDYAEANIAEAKQYGKPVVPFLWPRYHNSNAERGLQYLEADYWQLQLDTVRDLADGVVVWNTKIRAEDPSHWRDQLNSFASQVQAEEFSLGRALRQDASVQQETPGPAAALSARVTPVPVSSLFIDDGETDEDAEQA